MLVALNRVNKFYPIMKKEISFVKMNGAGNDFVIIDARKKDIEMSKSDCRNICDRKAGIGCDQLVIIENSNDFDCLMTIYNQDGTKSDACGNATRCVAAILFEENSSLQQVKIKTAADILIASRENDNMIAVKMGKIKFSWQDIPLSKEIETQGLDLLGQKIYCANIGNPHAVIFLDKNITDDEFYSLGSKIENDTLFPKKTNVEFAQITSDTNISARVWERGVGETKACGSGACAIVATAIKNNLINSNKAAVSYLGGDLTIEWNGNEDDPVTMTGGYQKEFLGNISLDTTNYISYSKLDYYTN